MKILLSNIDNRDLIYSHGKFVYMTTKPHYFKNKIKFKKKKKIQNPYFSFLSFDNFVTPTFYVESICCIPAGLERSSQSWTPPTHSIVLCKRARNKQLLLSLWHMFVSTVLLRASASASKRSLPALSMQTRK